MNCEKCEKCQAHGNVCAGNDQICPFFSDISGICGARSEFFEECKKIPVNSAEYIKGCAWLRVAL